MVFCVAVEGLLPVLLTGFVPLNEPEGLAVVLPDVPVPLDGRPVAGLPAEVAGFLLVVGRPCDAVPVEGLGAVTVWP